MAGYGRKRSYKKRSMRVRKTTPFKRVNSRALVAKKKTQSLVKLIKGVQLKQSETCYRTIKNQSFSLNHNSIYAAIAAWYPSMPAGQTMFPSQGNTDGNRKGDEILCQGMRFRCQLNVPYDRRSSAFKFFFVQWNTSQGSPGTRTDFLHDITGSIMLDPIQTDRWPGVKYLGTYRPISRDLSPTDQHSTILINKWIPFKKKVTFNNDGSEVPSNLKEEGAIIVFSYGYTGALQTDTLAQNCQCTLTLYYKDP